VLTVLFFVLSSLYLAVQTQSVQRFLTDRLTRFASASLGLRLHIGGVNFSLLNKIEMDNVWMEDSRGDTLAFASRISARIADLSFRNRQLDIGHLTLNHFNLNMNRDSAGTTNYSFLNSISKKDTLQKEAWKVTCSSFRLKNSGFSFDNGTADTTWYLVSDINFRIDHFRYSPDSIDFRLVSLTLADSDGFFLTDLSADFHTDPLTTSFSNLRLQTLHSEIGNARLVFNTDSASSRGSGPDMDITLHEAKVSLTDLAYFIPQLKGMDQELVVSGKITGSLRNLKAREMVITTGVNTRINCDLSLSLFEGISEPFIFLDLFQSQTDFNDISSIRLPESMTMKSLRFPEFFYQAGIITYQGNFTGFPTDFVAYGTFDSQMGQIKSDLSFVPAENGIIRYRGKIETTGFQVGKLIAARELGGISLNGMVKGTYNRKWQTVNADFDGLIDQFHALNYNYSGIKLNGKISNRKFDGKVIINDPNLKLNFSGLLNLDEKTPQFDFILNLKEADLVALKIDTVSGVSRLALGMTANFSGSSLDNFDGLVQVYDVEYANPKGSLLASSLTINTHLEESNSIISLNSDFLDASITGTYQFKSLFQSARNVLASYIPALKFSTGADPGSNRFDFQVTGKNMDKLAALFLPDFHVKSPFTLKGKIDSRQSWFELQGKLPGIEYGSTDLRNISISISPENSKLSSQVSIDEVTIARGLMLKNFDLSLQAFENQIHSGISWDNKVKNRHSGSIKSAIIFEQDTARRFPLMHIALQPSEIVIADSVWKLSAATAFIDSTDVTVNGFAFVNQNQHLTVNGTLSNDTTRHMKVNLEGFNLGILSGYLSKPTAIKGFISGAVNLSDFYGLRILNSDLKISGLEYRNQPFGDVSLVNFWDRNTESIKGDIRIIQEGRTSLKGSGQFQPKSKQLDFLVDLDNQSLSFLNALIRETFSNFHGDGSGRVRVTGTPEKILFDGAVFCKNGGLTIDYTQVSYLLNDSVRFAGDRIIFRNITLSDFAGNKGVFDGFIRHDSFQNMDYNLSVSSGKILAFNTTAKDNEIFYGKALARGRMTITGHDVDVKLRGEFTTLPETSVTIVLADETEVTKYDFVRFISGDKTAGTPIIVQPNPVSQGLEIDLIIHATPEARTQMIYNTQITDIIRAQGEGSIRFVMDKFENIFLYGSYTVEQGEYLFTLQDVIRKRFTVENGGSITWSGDPYNAVIDLQALYKLKASLYELMVNSLENVNSSQRIPVDCRITLTGDLMRPDITLGILFPGIEERLRDELQQFFSTQEDMNRQMLSLLVLGKFYTPDFVRGNYAADNSALIGNTASDLFSNQLSNWLSQINKDVNIGVNYRPGNQLTDDEIELALSTQIFNDRVRINGNIGNNANPAKSTSSELVGDFEIEVKISQNGKLQLKAYNRSNNNLIYETAPYTQGLGLSYKEEYNTFGELWKKLIGLFRK